MNTVFLLMAQHAKVVIPLDEVRRYYFAHLSNEKLMRKIGCGEIDLPVVRIEASQKSSKGVHVEDLASYLDKRRAAAHREAEALRT